MGEASQAGVVRRVLSSSSCVRKASSYRQGWPLALSPELSLLREDTSVRIMKVGLRNFPFQRS